MTDVHQISLFGNCLAYKVAFLTNFVHQIATLCTEHVRRTTLSFHTGALDLFDTKSHYVVSRAYDIKRVRISVVSAVRFIVTIRFVFTFS